MSSNDNGFRRLTSPVGGFRRTLEPIALEPFGGSERVCVGKAQVELALRLLGCPVQTAELCVGA